MNENIQAESSASRTGPIYNNVTLFKIFTLLCALTIGTIGGTCFAVYSDISNTYLDKEPLVYVFYAAIAIVCVLTFILASPGRFWDERLQVAKQRPSFVVGLVSGLVLVYLLVTIFTDTKDTPDFTKIFLIILVTLLATVYLTGVCKARSALNTVLGIAAIAWCLVMIVLTYFDFGSIKLPVNSPFEIICQFGLAFSMLFLISELRMDLGETRSRMYKFSACMAFCLNFAATVVHVVFLFKGRTDLGIYALPAFAMLIYSSKLFFTSSAPNVEEDMEYYLDFEADIPDSDTEIENNVEIDQEFFSDTEQPTERTQTNENIN